MTAILFFCLAVVSLVGHGYFWVAIVNRVHGLRGPRKFIDGTTIVSFLAFLFLPLYALYQWQDVYANWLASWNQTAGFAARYFQFCIAISAGELIVKLIFSSRKNSPDTLLNISKQSIELAAHENGTYYRGTYGKFLGAIPGNQSDQLQVERKQILIPRLNPQHRGLRIAHISDLHLTGRMEKSWTQRVIDQVLSLEADVIALTGDIIEREECFAWLEDTVCRLQAKLGVYFIVGNHDRFVDRHRTQELLVNSGLHFLGDSPINATWNGAPVLLAGNQQPWFPAAVDLPSVDARDDQNLPLRLFLLHTPDEWTWAIERDADLVLAGHTHGGQLCFPILGAVACPSLYGTRYADGVFRQGDHVMHVTRGLCGKTPLRWLCRPEIALLELESVG